MIRHYGLPGDFELSQAHIYKYDKMEKCNAALEVMYDFSKKGWDNQSLQYTSFFKNILSDGGTMAMFLNIIEKYGVVPKSAYSDSSQATHSGGMNDLLITTVLKTSASIRSNMTRTAFENLKTKTLEECHRIITLCLGNSPQSFAWSSKETTEHPKNYTPCSFYKSVVQKVVNLRNYVCIVNDPRHSYNKLIGVEYIHNVLHPRENNLQRKMTNVYLNLDVPTFKKAVFHTIDKHQTPVWFATDFSKFVLNDKTLMDPLSSTVEKLFQVDLRLDKKTCLETNVTVPNHAMVFTGCEKQGNQYLRWKVENSHGDSTQLHGFITMSDAYFDDYVIVAFVHKSTLSQSLREVCKEKKDVQWVPFWDVLGVFATQKADSIIDRRPLMRILPQ